MSEPLAVKICWLTINAYHEARGCSQSAQIAVCKTVLNRLADRRWPNTTKGVIWQPYQYSWTLNKKLWPINDYTALTTCSASAGKAYLQHITGRRHSGINHYYDVSIPKPYWAKDMEFIEQIGPIRFYKG